MICHHGKGPHVIEEAKTEDKESGEHDRGRIRTPKEKHQGCLLG